LPNRNLRRKWGFIVNFPILKLLLFPVLALLLMPNPSALAEAATDLNALVLAQIKTMPTGGQYAVTRIAANRLQAATAVENGRLKLAAETATPSYCSGATYLVFLKVIDALQRQGQLDLEAPVLDALLIRGQADGKGIWGRWNANGPGTPRLFHELKLGRNFDDYDRARPGDFMKIFWTKEVGKLERGHSVIYLGRRVVDGVESVRFWSSNQPDGYGEKTIPRSKIAYAIFSRLETPANLSRVGELPTADPYLSSLLSTRSSISEARAKSGF
jgi:hypothetical protein